MILDLDDWKQQVLDRYPKATFKDYPESYECAAYSGDYLVGNWEGEFGHCDIM